MFDSLNEQMKHDRDRESSSQQRILLWIAIAVASLIVFGGLYFGVSTLA